MNQPLQKPALDPQKLQQFIGKAVADLSANFSGLMVLLGHKLGFYASMADGSPTTAKELAQRTNTNERYALEWLSHQAAAGYVSYDPETQSFSLPIEHALVLASGDGPAFFPPAYETVAVMWNDEKLALDAFKSGRGVGWHEHDHRLFCATEAFFKPGYRAQLTTQWIPALTGIEERLKRGARVADVGCGHGASTILMAQAYPESEFWGFDYHADSIETARERAREAGVSERVHFAVASAQSYQGGPFDLICHMDCLHDMGDPVSAARNAKRNLSENGSVLLVEPLAGDRLEDNLNPVGALFYAASTVFCVPHSRSEDVGYGLGAQAGPARLREVFVEAGFSQLKQAAQTPFNLILEGRV